MKVSNVHGTIIEAVQQRIGEVNAELQRDSFKKDEHREVVLAEFAALNLIESLWMTQSVVSEDFDVEFLRHRAIALRAASLKEHGDSGLFPWAVAHTLEQWIPRIESFVGFKLSQEQMN
jgi:hypothetical protein